MGGGDAWVPEAILSYRGDKSRLGGPGLGNLSDSRSIQSFRFTPVDAADKSSVNSKLPITIDSDSENQEDKCVAAHTGLAAGTMTFESLTMYRFDD